MIQGKWYMPEELAVKDRIQWTLGNWTQDEPCLGNGCEVFTGMITEITEPNFPNLPYSNIEYVKSDMSKKYVSLKNIRALCDDGQMHTISVPRHLIEKII